MRRVILLLAMLSAPALARADIDAALRTRDWATADALAAGSPDPLARRLVQFLRLLTPGAAGAGEIVEFMEANGGWPQRGTLERRYADALAAERDDTVARALCGRHAPVTAVGALRCADALGRAGMGGAAEARRAWLLGITDPAAEIDFMRRWGAAVGAEDQRRRWDRLAWTENPAPGGVLARQAVRLDPAARPASEARLALRRDDPAGPALFAALPAPARSDPGLVLELARWYRRANRDLDAARVWLERGAAAEAAAPAERQALFWDERNVLARRFLRGHGDAVAYRLAALPTASSEARLDADFLAGWIALRRLGEPAEAATRFRALAAGSGSAITQGRAAYWLARAMAAGGLAEAAEGAFRQAAAWPTTYYGQLAALALGEGAGLAVRLRTLGDPAWSEDEAIGLLGSEPARAAALLAAWGEVRRAKPFLEMLEASVHDAAGRAAVARFAIALGLPDEAVAAARRAGRDGIGPPGSGWPEAADPPETVERAVALGLIRQESSFDPASGSPAGAQGLMQLMPATAAVVARRVGGPAGPLTDPGVNLRLGTAYLAGLLDRFGALPPALAAYNAGPGRAQEWLRAFGDPATGVVDPIDWVELIPFGETRNYVQRVVENVVIYRARDGAELPHPVLHWAAGGS